ncbi:unnamed protein product [Protopolystoma xenopodis]|uniref:Uncharacterized protein n=1 Tax=Protopolystoma xenopodis TaxID=117903 RepID=A0A448WL02_9PLAT|nr:unnamed protein product [Protopolystoma xenopodis]
MRLSDCSDWLDAYLFSSEYASTHASESDCCHSRPAHDSGTSFRESNAASIHEGSDVGGDDVELHATCRLNGACESVHLSGQGEVADRFLRGLTVANLMALLINFYAPELAPTEGKFCVSADK